MEQYPSEMPNRRMLYVDRMLREISHKTRLQLVLRGFLFLLDDSISIKFGIDDKFNTCF